MIPADVASRLQVSADAALRQVAPAQEITDKLSGLVAGQRVMAEIQTLLPNGTYRALINQRNLTLALPFSAKTGDAIELEVTESDGKLALAVVARGEAENKGARETTSATLSRTGQLISDLFAGAREAKGGAVGLALEGPISAAPPKSAQDLIPLLKQAIQQSGMFYESHQAEWVEGRLPTASLLQEPQGKLSSAAAFAAAAAENAGANTRASSPGEAAPAARALEASATAAETSKANASQSAASAPGQLVAPQTQAIVQQQLEALATQTFAWRGQVWPGQDMAWEIDEDASRAGLSDEPASQWTTRLRLVLPRLGEIDAQIRLQGDQVTLAMRSEKATTGETMRAASLSLRRQLDAAGLKVASIGVDPLPAEDGPA